LIYKYLGIYDKVLWLDDTCLIKKNTKDLFKMIDNNNIAAFNEGKNIDLKSWKFDYEFIKKNMNFDINTNKYINSGVVVYNSSIRDYFSIENIIKHSKLLESIYPHQAFLNYIIQKNNLSLYLLDESFNSMFINSGYTFDEKYLSHLNINVTNIISDEKQIIHITGFYINRFDILSQIIKIFDEHNL
jgi:uncharacterized protein (UPF0276 family)